MEQDIKANPLALIPFGVFIILFIGSGIITGDFYQMPVLVAVFAAILVALTMNKKTDFQTKLTQLTEGGGHPNIILMVVIFLLAGAFASVAEGVGAVDSTVNLGLSILPENLLLVGLFIICCFISISMGTSTGTIAALAPIGLGVADQTDIGLALTMGAIVSGSMFGDNLSIISDTTIAAVRTQGTQMKDKFKANFFIVLPAAIVTAVIFSILTANAASVMNEDTSFQLIKVLPYLGVLVFAVAGINVIFVLIGGIIFAGIVGLSLGDIALAEYVTLIGDGFANMQELAMLAILLGGLVELIRRNGGIAFLIQVISRRVSSYKGGELGIAGLVSMVNFSTANNTISIITAGPLARQMAERFDIDSRRSASLLDIFASAVQGVIPYGAQLLAVAGVAGISPVEIAPYCFYPMLIALAGLLAIAFGFPRFTVKGR
ncbi:sodium:proton antiporter [Halobacillus andaensis]|uniref:Sodium:proton antiporter n=1 Tax=Halobacillus andaensis TaxID=1176239 RepID=A0A917B0S9_HALAA|nr:Na+/H+ antiporter NhaC family protein [Halobacillus andaensis]MBP2003758.1 Na+/H+ antiporter NhaC [Halobacillus andaensis]GGF13019.1 sodium:proton antiporter [Halobacillus andaensis]